jgi:dTDP-4-dehydrorhamnose reductase
MPPVSQGNRTWTPVKSKRQKRLRATLFCPGTLQKLARPQVFRGATFLQDASIPATDRREGGDTGFKETDTPNFTFRTNHCSFYSGTKALGEEILDSYENVYVWRLRIPFDNEDSPRNYLTKLMRYQRLLEARNSISQRYEYAAACIDTWQRRVPFGKYNVTNPGSVTTREVVEHIIRSGVCNKKYDFFDSEDEFMRKAAKTPRSNCVLDTSKLEACGIRLTPVHEALDRALSAWKKAL